MPRKFLGQRIEKDIDFVRPSSVTLTADDLHRIPPFPTDIDEDGEHGFKHKISRNCGGTIRLRKRLESVPELFLHDLRKKPTRRKTKKSVALKRLELPKETLPVLTEEQSKPLFTDDELNRIFVSKPIVMPVKIEPINHNFTNHSNGSMSSNELLFEEIISAYSTAPSHKNPKLLDSEIDRVLAHISHKQSSKKPMTTIYPKIYNSESLRPMTPILDPVSPVMSEKISSPEYTGTSCSDRWSSGDEFSEIGGSEADFDAGGYFTAVNSLRSNCCSPNTPENSSTKHLIQPTKLRMSRIMPRKFTVRDDESFLSEAIDNHESVEDLSIPDLTAIRLLQEKIESIDIASSSSSIYSDHTA